MNPTPKHPGIEKIDSKNQPKTPIELEQTRQLVQDMHIEHKHAEKGKDKQTTNTEYTSVDQQKHLEKNIQNSDTEREVKHVQAEVERTIGVTKLSSTLSDKKNTIQEVESLGENYPTSIKTQVVGLIDTHPETIQSIDIVQRESLNIYVGWNLIGSLYAKLLKKHKNSTDKTIDTQNFLQDLQSIDISSLDALSSALTQHNADLTSNGKKILHFLSSSNFGKDFQAKAYPQIASTMSKNIGGFVDEYNSAIIDPANRSLLEQGLETTKTGVAYIRDGAKNVFNKDAWKNNPTQTAAGLAGIVGGAYVGYKALKGIFSRFSDDEKNEKLESSSAETSDQGSKKVGFWGKIFGKITTALKRGVPIAVGAYLINNLIHDKSLSELFKKTIPDQAGHIPQQAEAIKDQAQEKIQEKLEKIKASLKKKIEEELGKEVDEATFTRAFDEWKQKNHNHIRTLGVEETGNYADTGIGFLTLPFSSTFDLIMTLRKHGIIGRNNVARFATKESTNNIISYGIKGPKLLGQAFGWTMGQCTREDVSRVIKEQTPNMSSEERMHLWASLYRNGGILKNILAGMGTFVGLSSAFLFGGNTTLNRGQAYRSGITNNFDQQVKIFEELEKSLDLGDIHKGATTELAQSMHTGVTVCKHNTIIIEQLQNASSRTDFETKMKALGKDGEEAFTALTAGGNGISKHIVDATDLENQLKDKKITWNKAKSKIGNVLKSRSNNAVETIGEHTQGWTKYFKKLIPHSYFHHTDEIQKMIRTSGEIHERILQDRPFASLRNMAYRGEIGKVIVDALQKGETLKLTLKNAKDAKDFFENISILMKHAPATLNLLFRNTPLFFFGKELWDQLTDENNTNDAKNILATGLLSLVPIAGPFMLLREGTSLDDLDMGKIGFGAALIGYDVIRIIRAGKTGGIKNIGRLLLEAPLDAYNLIKRLPSATVTAFKLGADGLRVIGKPGGRSALAGFAKTSGLRALLAVGVVTATYMAGKRYLDGKQADEEQQKILDELHTNPTEYNNKMKKERPTLSPQEKQHILILAYAEQLGIEPDIITLQHDKTQVYQCILNTTIPIKKSDLIQAQNHIHDILSQRDDPTSTQEIRYSRNSQEAIREYILTTLQKNNDQPVTEQEIQEYIHTLGYTLSDFGYTDIASIDATEASTNSHNESGQEDASEVQDLLHSGFTGSGFMTLLRGYQSGQMPDQQSFHTMIAPEGRLKKIIRLPNTFNTLHARWNAYGEKAFIHEKETFLKLTQQHTLADHPMIHDLSQRLTALETGIKNNTCTSVADIESIMGKDFPKVFEMLKKGHKQGVIDHAHTIAKNSIEYAQSRTDAIKAEAQTALQSYEQKLKKTTDTKQKEKLKLEYHKQAQKLIKDYNTELAQLQHTVGGGIAYMQPDYLKTYASHSPIVKKILDLNGGIDTFTQKSWGGKLLTGGSKGLVVAGIALSLWNASEHGIEQIGLTVADMGLGMIPVASGLYDLGVAIKGQDITGHELSTKERIIRGSIGTICGVADIFSFGAATIVKGAIKGSVKAGQIATKTTRTVDAMVTAGKTATVMGRVGTYGALGYELVEMIIDGAHILRPMTSHLANEILDRVSPQSNIQ